MAKTTTTKKTTKVTKAAEVKTVTELQADLVALHAAQLEARKSHKQGELVNPRVLTTHRKDIARVHTAIAAAIKAEKTSTLKEEK